MSGKQTLLKLFGLFVILSMVLVPAQGSVTAARADLAQGNGPWWEVTPEPENPSPFYDSILYSEIAPKLRALELSSNRVRVEVIGQSAGGRNLFLVTVSAPEAMGRLGQYQAIRQAMLKDPDKAQAMIDQFGDFKVPVFINGSIHGNEYPGVDAAIRLIETFAYDNSPETQEILNNTILLSNVVQNPDGRVQGTRGNANGIDINRDFITQSQPEARATVKILTEWNPMVVLDLHGFVNPMLIEPCTPPHNPNYEYDLYIKWALDQAEAMEAELGARLGLPAQIPFRDFDLGWDDWPPTYTPMYAMYHGAYGHTLETSSRGMQGVDAHYWAVWGALKFAAQNRQAMVRDQIEIFRRGFLDLPQMRIPDEILDRTQYDQWSEMTVQEFPTAYLIPPGAPLQISGHQPQRLIQFLLDNDVQVEQASQGFHYDGVDFPAGTYVVWMDQPKRGLANTILDAGPDLSDIEGLYFYSPPSVWSNPLLWGVDRWVVQDSLEIQTHGISNPDPVRGSAERGKAGAYAFQPTSLAAFQAISDLLDRGEAIYRAKTAFDDRGRTFDAGTLIVSAKASLANELANQYALDVAALDALPTDVAVVQERRIAAYYSDAGTGLALRRLGFAFTPLSRNDLNAGRLTTGEFDLFINHDLAWSRLNAVGQASVAAFVEAGGDYIGIGLGASLAADAGFLDVTYNQGTGNAIVTLEITPGDSLSAGYPQTDTAFVYFPAWLTDLGPDVAVSARLTEGAFLVSGFWPGWQTSGAAGQPVVVHGPYGSADVTLIGTAPTFRNHPEDAFRLLGNAILDGLE